MKKLSFDPSGNFDEGKGTTGFAISLNGNMPHKLGSISAADSFSKHAYWFRHRLLIESVKPDILIIESYKLFGHKAKAQTGSSLETPQLIGYLEMVAYELDIPVVFQDPTTKSRHTDDILVKIGVLEKKGMRYYYKGELTNLHQRDALRHDLFHTRKEKIKNAK